MRAERGGKLDFGASSCDCGSAVEEGGVNVGYLTAVSCRNVSMSNGVDLMG